MKPILAFVTFLLFSAETTAQRGNNWVFGNKAIINFSTVPPNTGVSAMVQLEGSSSISDLAGNLLFYSDGVSVWNAQHQVMPNGTGLFGNMSSSQSSMIVPFPNDSNRYYIFTVDAFGGNHGLCYSVVNIELDGGKGDVEQKNIQLVTPTSEKITCVNHCNGKDVWVITHMRLTSEYYAYLVTAAGINTPVISISDRIIMANGLYSLGYIKASPDGTKIAAAHTYWGLDLLDFDSQTGQISNRRALSNVAVGNTGPYGVEFSPDSKLLYCTNSRKSTLPNYYQSEIDQYSFLNSDITTILNSKIKLDEDSTIFLYNHFSALQLGPDGKLYMANQMSPYLAVVNNPNITGFNCNYIRYALRPANGTGARYGLPDFNQSYFKGSFSYIVSCTTTSADFYYSRPINAMAVKWNFGDPLSGINNTATIDSPMHVFSAPGTYTVKLIVGLSCRNDTMVKTVKVDPFTVNLGPDKRICYDSSVLLDPQSGKNRTYLWQDNSTDSTLVASDEGLYWVEVTNPDNGCKIRDSVLLINKPNPVNNLGPDSFLCERKNLLLDAGNPGAQYTWQDNSTSQTLLVKKQGTYSVKVNLEGCIIYDTINIRGEYFPRVYLGNDTAMCDGMTITLRPFLNHAENASFLWSNGDTSHSITIDQPGSYSLEVSNICGIAADGIVVKQGVCKLYMPTGFTPNNDGKNDIMKPGYGENVTSFKMEIYNRWGEKVFISDKIFNGWDGKLKGVLQPAGIYVWFIRYKVFNDPVEYSQKGTVSLIY